MLLGFASFLAGFWLIWTGSSRRFLRGPDGRVAWVRGAGATSSQPGPLREGGKKSGHGCALDDVPLLLELLGVMLQAGLGLPRALEVASRVAGTSAEALGRAAAALELGTAWTHAWPDASPSSAVGQIRAALYFAAATGAPSAELLYSRARQLRRTRHRDLEKRAAALGVRLVVPLGVCSLPAFLCLGVVPVLLAMIPGG